MSEEQLRAVLLRKIYDLEQQGIELPNIQATTSIDELKVYYALMYNKHNEICKRNIRECYEHIVKYWEKEYYMKCKQEWKSLEFFILPEYFSIGHKCSCGTRWVDKKFINKELDICCSCDRYVQPYLSNPLNKSYVLEYIPEEFHECILIEYKCVEEIEKNKINIK